METETNSKVVELSLERHYLTYAQNFGSNFHSNDDALSQK